MPITRMHKISLDMQLQKTPDANALFPRSYYQAPPPTAALPPMAAHLGGMNYNGNFARPY